MSDRVLSSARHPWTVLVALAMVYSGVVGLVTQNPPGTLDELLGPLLTNTWLSGCAIGGAAVIVGGFTRNRWSGARSKRSGCSRWRSCSRRM